MFNDHPAGLDLDPWLASLLILPAHRGQGHVATLIEVAIAFAAAAGYPSLHLFTETAATLFLRHGFTKLESHTIQGHSVTLLRRPLPL